MRLSHLLCGLLLSALLAACGEDHAHHDHDGHDHASHAGHDHDNHAGHDHGDHAGHDHSDHDHGEAHELGSVSVGDYQFQVTQHGAIIGQAEAVLTIHYSGDNAPELRAWVGKENGRGSVKALLSFDADKKHYHGHLEVPASLSDDAALYLSVGDNTGKIAFKK